MSGISQQACHHSQFTGYDDHCVCINCGWSINYDEIKIERNDASLENYISTVLDQIESYGEVAFDLGVTTQGVVEQGSTNRVKFTLRRSLKKK